MTTSPPAVSSAATKVCRITVEGPTGRADLALPVSTPLVTLLPALLRHVTAEHDQRPGAPWVLQRLGDKPLALDQSPELLRLRHGDVLHLRPADEPLPEIHFDDISVGVAHSIGNEADRWRPELTRTLSLFLAVLLLAGVAVTLYGAGPGRLTAMACTMVAVALAASGVVLSRVAADQAAVRTAGVGALVFIGLAGLTPFHGSQGHFVLGHQGLLLAAGEIALLAAMLLPLRVLPTAVTGSFLLAAAATAIGVALARIGDLSPLHAVGVLGVVMFVIGHFGPRLALRAARLRIPHLPRTAEELQQDIDPESEGSVTRRVRAANSSLNALSIASALVYVVSFVMLVRDGGWIGWVLPTVFSFAVLLRARNLTGALQRIPMTVAGAFGLAVVLTTWLAPLNAVGRGVALGVLVVAAGALLVAAWRLPLGGRLLPVWGHVGDILEMTTAIALLPLLLQSLHVYTYFRALVS